MAYTVTPIEIVIKIVCANHFSASVIVQYLKNMYYTVTQALKWFATCKKYRAGTHSIETAIAVKQLHKIASFIYNKETIELMGQIVR